MRESVRKLICVNAVRWARCVCKASARRCSLNAIQVQASFPDEKGSNRKKNHMKKRCSQHLRLIRSKIKFSNINEDRTRVRLGCSRDVCSHNGWKREISEHQQVIRSWVCGLATFPVSQLEAEGRLRNNCEHSSRIHQNPLESIRIPRNLEPPSP